MKMFDDTFICKTRGCINERKTKRYCRSCQDKVNIKSKKKRLDRKANGQCRQCNVKRMKTSSYCVYHYMKMIAKKTAHDPRLGPLLYKKYLNQYKKCYYTGIPIELGVNASLDHVHCQSKYEHWKSDIRNMVWTTKRVNTSKTDLELNEFLTICEMVSRRSNTIRNDYGI